MEDWKIVKDFPNYRVSNYGRVRRQKIIESFDKKGIPVIRLVDPSGKPSIVKLEKIVATAFCENEYELKHVRHIDGHRNNNNAVNLMWTSIERS